MLMSLATYSGIGGGVGDKVVYTGNLIFLDNVFVENKTNIQFASYSQVQESVIVALGLLAKLVYTEFTMERARLEIAI